MKFICKYWKSNAVIFLQKLMDQINILSGAWDRRISQCGTVLRCLSSFTEPLCAAHNMLSGIFHFGLYESYTTPTLGEAQFKPLSIFSKTAGHTKDWCMV